LPRKESFYNSKFVRTPQFYSDSGSTGQTGVAVVGSATRRPTGQTVEGHRSDRWCQPDRPCAKFGCEQATPRSCSARAPRDDPVQRRVARQVVGLGQEWRHLRALQQHLHRAWQRLGRHSRRRPRRRHQLVQAGFTLPNRFTEPPTTGFGKPVGKPR
jgi:hypothetical protein